MNHEATITQDELDRSYRLTRVVAHELRTPLGAVFLQAQLLEMEAASDPATGERVEGILRGCRQLSRQLDDMVELAHAESGALALRVETIELGRFIMHLEERCPGVLALERVRLTSRGARARVACDPDRLERILLNVLAYALEHAGEADSVAVCLREVDDRVHVEVAIAGMPHDPSRRTDLDHTFGEFRTRRTGAAGRGTPLGLYVAWLLARAHGGDLQWLSGTADTATLCLSLPASRE